MAKAKKRTSNKQTVPAPIAYDEVKWRAESDARTLAEAAVINSDKKRLKLAVKAAQGIANEKMKEAKAMVGVSSKGK